MNKAYFGIFTVGVGVGVGGTILFNKFALPFIQKKRAEKTIQFEAGPIEYGSKNLLPYPYPYPQTTTGDLTLEEIKKKAAEYASASANTSLKQRYADLCATEEQNVKPPFDELPDDVAPNKGFKTVVVSEDLTYDYDIVEDEADEWVANHEGIEAVDVLFDIDKNAYIKMHDPNPVETRFDFGGRTTEIFEILMMSTTGKINVYIPEVEMLFVIYDSDRTTMDDEEIYYEEDVDEDE